MWHVRLRLFPQHNPEKEKKWWSKKLGIPIENFKIKEISKGDERKKSYAPHGGCFIELYSVIFSALLDNLINLFKHNLI